MIDQQNKLKIQLFQMHVQQNCLKPQKMKEKSKDLRNHIQEMVQHWSIIQDGQKNNYLMVLYQMNSRQPNSGANAAIVHYHPTENNKSIINPNNIYLIDSGGQYLDETTDVTRTYHFTQPTIEEKNAYTRVLLGNLDIERLKWPKKSKIHGGDMDVLARRWLWEVNLDYGHGTGHGVGYFLNVHEGPHGISKYRTEVFQPGMIVSNEPGYYEEGKFGIRIENLILCVQVNDQYLGFENITFCPYDRKLINLDLLSPRDRNYIDQYHNLVRNTLLPLIEDQTAKEWLLRMTEPL